MGMNPGPFGMAQVCCKFHALSNCRDDVVSVILPCNSQILNPKFILVFVCEKTGVPFGDCVLVRDFLHITAEVHLHSESKLFFA